MSTAWRDLMSDADPMTARRACSGTSKQTGKPCGATPPPGALVCKWHGGAAPQVKQAAAERLLAMVDPAMTALKELLEAESEDVRFRAAKDVLDRTGYKPKERQEIEHRGNVTIYLPERGPITSS